MERRDFFKLGAVGAVGLAATASDGFWLAQGAQAAEASPAASAPLTPDAALDKLIAGNQRFVRHHPQYPDQTAIRLKEVALAQHPFATVLCCADSRVPVEILFDQGVGDIFDVRVAGNIVAPAVLGSIEYAIALLETPVLMVLGHERCGAVTAAVKHESLPGDMSRFVEAILPALDTIKGATGDAVDNAVTANVRYQMTQLQRSDLINQRLEAGKLKLVGGRYDLDTGTVTLIT